MEKISVIVPIFNAGPYLKQCIESILQQSYPCIELILVNDGSTDGSAALCEHYRQTAPRRTVVIHRPLGGSGVGAARNEALAHVTGDYILFVDHDDWLEPTHIEDLYQALTSTQSDIAVTNFTQFIEERSTFAFHLKKEDYFQAIYHPREWFKKEYDGQFSFSQCFTVPWGKLYKASLFEHIYYPEDQTVEDDYTTWKLYLMADQIVYTNASTYYHRKRSTSVTKIAKQTEVFPLKSIEERVTILSLIGFDIQHELRAYRYRLQLHKETLLDSGHIKDYYRCLQKIRILEKWGRKES